MEIHKEYLRKLNIVGTGKCKRISL